MGFNAVAADNMRVLDLTAIRHWDSPLYRGKALIPFEFHMSDVSVLIGTGVHNFALGHDATLSLLSEGPS